MDDYPLAIVTGAAHRLGRTFALALARQRYAVLLHYHHSLAAAETTVNEIKAMDVPARLVEADLTDVDQIYHLFSVADSMDSSLKILVNSAAEMRRADLRTITPDVWDDTLKLNLRAPLLLAQQAAERMTKGGLIVNVTDAGVGKTSTGFPAYTVSKAGLEVLTRLLAKSFAPNIRVNAIAPGLVLPSKEISTEVWDRLINQLPLKHPVSLAEIAATLEFLIKNDSITGQTVIVDGGFSLH